MMVSFMAVGNPDRSGKPLSNPRIAFIALASGARFAVTQTGTPPPQPITETPCRLHEDMALQRRDTGVNPKSRKFGHWLINCILSSFLDGDERLRVRKVSDTPLLEFM
jgi:hypothetical protein